MRAALDLILCNGVMRRRAEHRVDCSCLEGDFPFHSRPPPPRPLPTRSGVHGVELRRCAGVRSDAGVDKAPDRGDGHEVLRLLVGGLDASGRVHGSGTKVPVREAQSLTRIGPECVCGEVPTAGGTQSIYFCFVFFRPVHLALLRFPTYVVPHLVQLLFSGRQRRMAADATYLRRRVVWSLCSACSRATVG